MKPGSEGEAAEVAVEVEKADEEDVDDKPPGQRGQTRKKE